MGLHYCLNFRSDSNQYIYMKRGMDIAARWVKVTCERFSAIFGEREQFNDCYGHRLFRLNEDLRARSMELC